MVLVSLREDESELHACAEAVPCILEYSCCGTFRACGDDAARVIFRGFRHKPQAHLIDKAPMVLGLLDLKLVACPLCLGWQWCREVRLNVIYLTYYTKVVLTARVSLVKLAGSGRVNLIN
jgi:hypothetical protein